MSVAVRMEHAMGTLRVVCYVNQFFGQLGGEEQAGVGPDVVAGAVGAARAVQQALGRRGTVVATVRCGDNYVAERPETAVAELVALVAAQRPDLLVAGPAFQAGRYGVACGALCAAVQSQLGVPAVTGMHDENPGVDLYRRPVYIAETGADTARMLDEVRRIVALGLKLARARADRLAGRRGVLRPRPHPQRPDRGRRRRSARRPCCCRSWPGDPVTSEVPLPTFAPVPAPARVPDMRRATIALVTDGGLVPRGNPDGIEALAATRFGGYEIVGLTAARSGPVRQRAPRLRHDLREAGPASPRARRRGPRAGAGGRGGQAPRGGLLDHRRRHDPGPQPAHGPRDRRQAQGGRGDGVILTST